MVLVQPWFAVRLVDLLLEHSQGVRAVSALLHFGQQGLSVEQAPGPHSEQESAHLLFLALVARSMTGPPVDILQRQFVQFTCVPVSHSPIVSRKDYEKENDSSQAPVEGKRGCPQVLQLFAFVACTTAGAVMGAYYLVWRWLQDRSVKG